MPIGMSTCYLIRYNQTMPLAAAIQNPEPPPRLRQEALLASPDQLPKYCHQSPLLTAPGASQSFHPPPTSQRFEQISAVVIPKARTLRQPFYHIPSLNPKPLTIIAMCCIISPANQYLELPPPLHQDDRQKHFRPSPQLPGMVAKAHLPPLMLQWLLYPAFHVARTNENVIN